jgi:tetratricopeptide (TPR) repeat protein
MSNHRITRRQALAAGFAGAAGLLAAAPVPKTDPNLSWVGKTVLPRKYATPAAYPLPDPPNPEDGPAELSIVLDGASYAVKGEKGTRVEVFHSNGLACWVEKEQLVPLADAVEFFTKAIQALKENAKDPFSFVSRGWAYYLLGKPDKAVADFDEFLKQTPVGSPALAGVPDRWEGLVNRGLVFAEQGEFEKAFQDLDALLLGWPAIPIAYVNRGFAHELNGNYKEALADYDEALKVAPSHTLAANNRAWTRSTCPDEKFRDAAEAARLAKAVCEATRNREGMFLDTLAAAYAEAGKFPDAVKAQEQALEDKSFAARYGEDGQNRLQLYKDKKPFRTAPPKK